VYENAPEEEGSSAVRDAATAGAARIANAVRLTADGKICMTNRSDSRLFATVNLQSDLDQTGVATHVLYQLHSFLHAGAAGLGPTSARYEDPVQIAS
jgi:hypothetical protein